jgi:hypothetical protein
MCYQILFFTIMPLENDRSLNNKSNEFQKV